MASLPQQYTVYNATYDNNNDQTYVKIEEELVQTGSGTLITEEWLTPTSRDMHLSGGVMYWGNVTWPTRFPDVVYTEDGNYDVRLQNEYTTSGITIRGPLRELTGVSKVMAAWHLEGAMHVYVSDTVTQDIVAVDTSNDWFEVSGKYSHIYSRNKTATVRGRVSGNPTDWTITNSDYTGGNTRIYVSGDITDSTVAGTIEVQAWDHFRRATPSEQGLYSVEGANYKSLFVFDADRYVSDSGISYKSLPPGTSYIDESPVAVSSRVNRPFEITTNGFSVEEDENIRAIMPARLAEAEGLREYDFYVATDKSVYAVSPDTESETVQKYVVASEFGVGESIYANSVYAVVPGGVVILDTSGYVRFLTGRKEERIFGEGQVPWGTVYDIAYNMETEEVALATDQGTWFYDWNRKGIFRQYDHFNPRLLAYDRNDSVILAWNETDGEWRALDGSGSDLEPSVTTQPVETGGRELIIEWIKADYDKSGYVNTDASTFAELWHVVNSDEVMGYGDNPQMIVATTETINDETSGNTSIEVGTDGSGSVDLKSGDKIRFVNHDTSYEVASDVTIGNGSTGTITLSSGLSESVPQYTSVRPDKYRGIIKLPRRERIGPPFRGSGHQLRVRKFDTLRDIQVLLRPRVNYE